MDSFSPFALVQIAIAVLGGNLLTLMFVKGWQMMDDAWWRYFVPIVPLAFIALVILAA